MIICQDGSLIVPEQVSSYTVIYNKPGMGASPEGTHLGALSGSGRYTIMVKNVDAKLASAIFVRLADRLQEPGVIRIMDIVKEVQEGW